MGRANYAGVSTRPAGSVARRPGRDGADVAFTYDAYTIRSSTLRSARRCGRSPPSPRAISLTVVFRFRRRYPRCSTTPCITCAFCRRTSCARSRAKQWRTRRSVARRWRRTVPLSSRGRPARASSWPRIDVLPWAAPPAPRDLALHTRPAGGRDPADRGRRGRGGSAGHARQRAARPRRHPARHLPLQRVGVRLCGIQPGRARRSTRRTPVRGS